MEDVSVCSEVSAISIVQFDPTGRTTGEVHPPGSVWRDRKGRQSRLKPRVEEESETISVELTDGIAVCKPLETGDLQEPEMSVYSLEAISASDPPKTTQDTKEPPQAPEAPLPHRRRGRPRIWRSDADRKRLGRQTEKAEKVRPEASVLDAIPVAQRKRPERRPSKSIILAKISEQNNTCAYCGNEFGIPVRADGKTYVLEPQTDHVKPRALRRDDRGSNLVAACQVCNTLIKRNHCFESVGQAQEIIRSVWVERHYEVINVVPEEVIDRVLAILYQAKTAPLTEEQQTELEADYRILRGVWKAA